VNTNSLCVQFFPKGSCFEKITGWHVISVRGLLNKRSVKTLGYAIPKEVLFRVSFGENCAFHS